MMKKLIFLYAFTIAALTGIFISSCIINAAYDAQVFVIKPSTGEELLTASGRLQYGKQTAVRADNYAIIDEIFVKNGDKVRKGEVLMRIFELSAEADEMISSPDIKKLLGVISANSLPEELKNEIRKYSVEREITAECDGIVSGLEFSENDIAVKNDVLMKIADTSEYCIPVNINETYISRIKKGQKVRIGFAAEDTKKYSGKVQKIAKEAKQISSISGKETCVEVTIRLDKPDPALRIGYSAECSIIVAQDKNVLVVPYEYIISGYDGQYVFTERNGKAVKTMLKTGKEYKNGIQIISGLESGDRLIINSSGLKDGMKISVIGESSVV